MARITKSEVEGMQERLNHALGREPHGEGYIFVAGRYGYQAIDKIEGRGVSTITSGLTMREAYDFLWAMCKGIEEMKNG